jgi:hypothetical protein
MPALWNRVRQTGRRRTRSALARPFPRNRFRLLHIVPTSVHRSVRRGKRLHTPGAETSGLLPLRLMSGRVTTPDFVARSLAYGSSANSRSNRVAEFAHLTNDFVGFQSRPAVAVDRFARLFGDVVELLGDPRRVSRCNRDFVRSSLGSPLVRKHERRGGFCDIGHPSFVAHGPTDITFAIPWMRL